MSCIVRRIGLLILVCLLAIGPLLTFTHPASASETIPLDDYVKLVERVEAAAKAETSLATLASELEAVTAVAMPDGTTAPVDNLPLLSRMRQADSAAEFEQVAARAGALLAELRAAQSAGATREMTNSMSSLNGVLSDPNLQRPLVTSTPRPQPQEQPRLEFPRIGGDVIRLILAIAGGAGVIFLIVALGPTLFRFFASRRPRLRQADGDGPDEVATSAEAVERAQHASAIQDYRLATRMLYLASLLKLDESGALRYDRTQTNREYVRQVAAQPPLADALRVVVEVFDDVWYGFRPITPEGYGEFAGRVDEVLHLASGSQETEVRRRKAENVKRET